MRKFSLACFWMISLPALSQSFGVVGEVFPLAEMSLLQLIQVRLQQVIKSGELDAINQGWQRKIAAQANRPSPLNLAPAKKRRIHYFRPEIVLDGDIKDAEGRVIYSSGTKVNALQQLPLYSPCWLFLNGDEMAEQKWAQRAIKACSNPKIILTGGSIHEAETFLNTVIYFDQGGVLTQKLGIRALPARVIRGELSNHDALQVEEIAIKENSDVL